MTDEIDWDRLARYVSGEATAHEREGIERWASADPARLALLHSLEGRWRATRSPETWDVDRAWSRMAAKLAEPHPAATEDVVPLDAARRHRIASARPRWSARLFPLAAAAVLVAGVVFVWRRFTPEPVPAAATLTATSGEVATAVGERRTLDLPDGSHVVLGAASTLRIDTAYGRGSRQVSLEGQALFRVTHDSTRPFVVHAAGTLAEDLGTEFDVRAYPGDSIVRVAVIEGAVAVRRAQTTDSAALLRPRDVARIDATGGAAPVILHDQDVERLVAWTAGELNFRDATLTEVARELERWFDVDVRVTSEAIAGRRYTVNGLRTESLDDLLGVIDLSLPDVVIERQGRVVTFSPGTGVGRIDPAPPRSSRVEAGA
jgi:ferric-dicitrate binding protein FerR (iron transport regulator)